MIPALMIACFMAGAVFGACIILAIFVWDWEEQLRMHARLQRREAMKAEYGP